MDPAHARPARLGLVVAALLGLGLVLVATAADTPAARRFGLAPREWVGRQAGAVALGAALLLLAWLAGRRRLVRLGPAAGLLLVGCAALTLVPGPGLRSGGAWRQVQLLGVVWQPTILLAAVLPLALAGPLARGRILWLVALVGGAGAVCLLQPNFGHLGTILAAAAGTLLGLGRRGRRPLAGIAAAFALAAPLAASFPYVRWRLRSFLEPGLTRDTQGLVAIHEGATWLGTGLGQGGDKALLSAAPGDYLFAVALEELGRVGALGLLLLCALLPLTLWEAAGGARRGALGRAVAGGVACSLAFPALVHVLVSLRLFPVTGIHLPLASHSGSATVAALLGLGLALGARR